MEGSQDDPLAMSRWRIRQKLHDLLLIAIHQPTLTASFVVEVVWVGSVSRHQLSLTNTTAKMESCLQSLMHGNATPQVEMA